MANRQTPKRSRSKRDGKQQTDRGTSQNGNGDGAATYEQELAQYLQERIKPGLNRGSIPLLARSIAKELAHRRHDEDAEVAGEPSTEEDEALRDESDDASGEVDVDVDEEDEDDVRGEAVDEVDEEDEDDMRGEVDDDVDEEDEDDVRGEVDDDVDEEDEDDVRGEVDDDVDEEDEDDVRGEAVDDVDEEDEDDVRGEADDDFGDEEEDDNEGSFEDELRDLQANLGDDWILRFSIQGEDTWLTAEKDDGSQHVEAPAVDVLADVVELLNEGGGRSS